MSNWEQTPLAVPQLTYAALDGWRAVHIFLRMTANQPTLLQQCSNCPLLKATKETDPSCSCYGPSSSAPAIFINQLHGGDCPRDAATSRASVLREFQRHNKAMKNKAKKAKQQKKGRKQEVGGIPRHYKQTACTNSSAVSKDLGCYQGEMHEHHAFRAFLFVRFRGSV
jgi:hypothetical protein